MAEKVTTNEIPNTPGECGRSDILAKLNSSLSLRGDVWFRVIWAFISGILVSSKLTV